MLILCVDLIKVLKRFLLERQACKSSEIFMKFKSQFEKWLASPWGFSNEDSSFEMNFL